MARYHTTAEGNVPFTAAEEAERDAEELAYQNAKPMEDWQASMASTDAEMPRYIEDILDKIGTAGLPQEMIVRYNSKKLLRGNKPT